MDVQYGDPTSADLMLRLFYPDGSQCEGNPIPVHFHLLSQKSEYFKTLLSGRWSSAEDHPNLLPDFTINEGSSPDEYIRCIKLLYAPKHRRHVILSGVAETLKIIQVASQWLILEVAEACTEYLEPIPWSDDETLQIQTLVSSLQIKVSPDMSARLSASQSQYLKSMEAELKQMLSFIGDLESFQTTCYELVAANCGENCSKQLKDLTKALVLQEARMYLSKMSMNKRSHAKDFLWFIRTLRSLEVTEYVSFLDDAICVYSKIEAYKDTKNQFLNMLDDAFKKMASGKLILQRKDRLKLVTNWLPIIHDDHFMEKNTELRTSLQQGLDSVINTLPTEDYFLISKTWEQGPRRLYYTAAYRCWIERLRSGCNRT